MIKFSIIIPILNEAKNIQKLANILKKNSIINSNMKLFLLMTIPEMEVI